MEEFIGLTAVILIFGSIPAIIIYISWRRSQERMEMIRKGVNPIVFQQMQAPKVGSGDLKAGIIITAVGIGCAIGASQIQRSIDRDLMTVAVIVIMIGLSLLLYWAIIRKERERVQQIYERQLEKLAEHYTQDTINKLQ
jgi:preprotein translocase subunit YajC